jgi:hypothetical protein
MSQPLPEKPNNGFSCFDNDEDTQADMFADLLLFEKPYWEREREEREARLKNQANGSAQSGDDAGSSNSPSLNDIADML